MLLILKKGLVLFVLIGALLPILSAQSGNLDDIKDQFIDSSETFTPINIADFILPGVTCGTIEISSVREVGTDTKPTAECLKTQAYHSTMNARILITYGLVENYNHEDDYLLFYNDKGEVIECGGNELMQNDVLLNEPTFALSLNGGSTPSAVKMEFFSGKDQTLYTIDSAFQYLQNSRMGKIGAPDTIDLAPISMSFDGNTLVSPLVKDTTFRGQICYTVTVTDCDNGQTGTDEICFSIGEKEELCQESYSVISEIFTEQEYTAQRFIEADNIIRPSADVVYKAGESILLKPNFEVKAGANFLATIEACEPSTAGILNPNDDAFATLRQRNDQRVASEQLELKIMPNPVRGEAVFLYYLPHPQKVTIQVTDLSGQVVKNISSNPQETGWHQTVLQTENWQSGLYFVTLFADNQVVNKKILHY